MQPPAPIIVEVIKQPAVETTVVDVLLGAIGLTGIFFLAAVVLGGLLGALLIWLRIVRPRYSSTPAGGTERTRLGLEIPDR